MLYEFMKSASFFRYIFNNKNFGLFYCILHSSVRNLRNAPHRARLPTKRKKIKIRRHQEFIDVISGTTYKIIGAFLARHNELKTDWEIIHRRITRVLPVVSIHVLHPQQIPRSVLTPHAPDPYFLTTGLYCVTRMVGSVNLPVIDYNSRQEKETYLKKNGSDNPWIVVK